LLVRFTDRKIFLRHGREIQRFGQMGDIRNKRGILKRDIPGTKDSDKIHNLPGKCKPQAPGTPIPDVIRRRITVIR
jgi:hypothetical protein